ncbi:hypothetical protein BJV74DRAFT_779024, partial [Russula compacta]
FGIVKQRFKLMVAAPEYDINTQAQFVPAMAALHNFIRIHDPDDHHIAAECNEVYGGRGRGPARTDENLGGTVPIAEWNWANAQCDTIARAMWVQYEAYLAQNS